MNDDEVLHQVQGWWKRYGTTVVVALAVAVAAVAGTVYWQRSTAAAVDAAQGKLEQMTTLAQQLIANPNEETALANLERLGNEIREQHGRTPQAVDAALIQAGRAADRSDWAAAEAHLRWALERTDSEALAGLIQVRLARVLSMQDKLDEGLALLDRLKEPSLQALSAETRGDLLMDSGRRAEAKTAYQEADAAMAAQGAEDPLLTLKLADVGLSPAPRVEASEE